MAGIALEPEVISGMPASEIVIGICGALLAAGTLTMVPAVWAGWFTRRESRFRGRLWTHGELATIWAPFSDATRRGLMRGFAPLALAWSGLVVGYWVAALNNGAAADSSHGKIAAVPAAAGSVPLMEKQMGLTDRIRRWAWPRSWPVRRSTCPAGGPRLAAVSFIPPAFFEASRPPGTWSE
jgi:hypothetical protein